MIWPARLGKAWPPVMVLAPISVTVPVSVILLLPPSVSPVAPVLFSTIGLATVRSLTAPLRVPPAAVMAPVPRELFWPTATLPARRTMLAL